MVVVGKLARFCDVKERSWLRWICELGFERGKIISEEGTCQLNK